MKIVYNSLIVLFFINISLAQNTTTFFKNADTFFKENVSNGKVNYDAIKKNATSINDLAIEISKINVSKENVTTQKAFLINSYNILLIKAIITKYPVKSPLDIAGLFDKTTHTVSGQKYTLNDIENKLIRAKFNDARVHFVLVCGANGCPPITNFAYTPNELEEQLNKQTKLAINDANFIKVNAASKKVEVSQIFEWYNADFVSKNQTLIDFLNKYRNEKIDSKFKISYYTYNWVLNKK